jgi:streptogramin lyase
MSMATGSDGNVYWVDGRDGGVYGLASDGSVSTLASLGSPLGICTGADGALYIADEEWSALVRVTLDGSITTVSQPGDLSHATAVGCDPAGIIYVIDAVHGRLVPFDPAQGAGAALIDDTYTRGVLDGPLGQAMLGGGRGLAARNGRVVFSEGANASVRQLWNGEVHTLAGGATARLVDGPGANAGFGIPAGIATNDDGSFLVADTGNAAVRLIVPADARPAPRRAPAR